MRKFFSRHGRIIFGTSLFVITAVLLINFAYLMGARNPIIQTAFELKDILTTITIGLTLLFGWFSFTQNKEAIQVEKNRDEPHFVLKLDKKHSETMLNVGRAVFVLINKGALAKNIVASPLPSLDAEGKEVGDFAKDKDGYVYARFLGREGKQECLAIEQGETLELKYHTDGAANKTKVYCGVTLKYENIHDEERTREFRCYLTYEDWIKEERYEVREI